MASTVGPRYVTGTLIATNALLEIRKVGFKPDKVSVYNMSTNMKLDWFDDLGEDTAFKTTDTGVRSFLSSGAISTVAGTSTQPPGFSISAVADINDTTTEVIKYEAWG